MKNAIQLRKLFVQTISAVLIFISFPSRTFASSQTDQVQQNDEISTQVQAFGIDAGYEAQWGLQIIHANEVWSVSTGRSVLVAVVDSGSGPNADLTANLSPGRSIIRGRSNDGGNDVDPNGHGTHVAGIIAAQANNDIGVAGVAPDAKILPIRVLDSNGDGSEADVALAIRYAVDVGARVINLSLGGIGQTDQLQTAIQYASDKNVLVIAAAGNAGPNAGVTYPAGNDLTLAVTATDQTMTSPSFAQRGSYIDITAPGIGICSAIRLGSRVDATRSCATAGEPYVTMSGTSMATAFVSGVAALIISANPTMTAVQVREVILATATDIGAPGRDDTFGAGLVNVYAIFRALGYFAGEIAYPTFSPVGRMGVEILANTMQLPPTERLQWFRCSSPGVATVAIPVDCVTIARAQDLRYTPTADDLGLFLRLGSLITLGGTPQIRFSATTNRVTGVWASSTAIEVGSNIAISNLFESASNGKLSLKVISGPCAVKNKSSVAFNEIGKCLIRVSSSAKARYPKLTSKVLIDIIEKIEV